MEERRPPVLLPKNLGTHAVIQKPNLSNLRQRRSESARYRTLDSKPVVRQVAHRSVQPDGAGIEQRRAETLPREADTKLPAVVIADGGSWCGIGNGLGRNSNRGVVPRTQQHRSRRG